MKIPSLLLFLLLLMTGCGGNMPPARLQPVVVKQESPEMTLQHSYYTSNDSLHLFLRFEDARKVIDPLQAATSYEFDVRSGSTEKDELVARDSVDMPKRKITDTEGQVTVEVLLPAQVVQEPNVLHLRLWQQLMGQELMGTKFRLPLHQRMLQKKYLLMNAATGKPLLQNYATTSDKLYVQRYGADSANVTLQRFDPDFMPAAPPMSMRPPAGPRTLSATDVYTIGPADTLSLQQEGIYRVDPNTSYARSLLVLPGRFPQVTRPQEMLQPLVYLTTSEEREALLEARDTKAAIDRFWLDLGGSKAAARTLIREFYSRVELANRLYSSHKAGWATDRGMIYIIFGQPSQVSEVGSTITWLYRDAEEAPFIKFVFTKKENTFTENHYELIRRREYGESWFSTVAKWRAGRINT
ncbi:hypothetical protein GCM10023188_21900 [Pontibacter saemangeumensis]|uniref:GWxTD domain-containing protein n=1 Tax=Pontibacter saemangeumensis TaxID=1084525 RepID=A0ABP8LQ31_9BACT